MNITGEYIIELEPDASDAKTNRRIWNFLLASFLLHLLIVELLIDHFSLNDFTRPYRVIPKITITLNSGRSAAQSVPVSPPVAPVKETDETKRHENSANRTLPLPVPTTVPPETSVSLPAQSEQKLLPQSKELIDKSLDYAAKTGKEMEARVKPDDFMTRTNRDKLVMAMIMQEQQDPTIDNPAKLQVYHNQMGDRIYQTGDKCYVIPSLLFMFTFKEINSIIAMPMLGGCPGSNKEKGFSLK